MYKNKCDYVQERNAVSVRITKGSILCCIKEQDNLDVTKPLSYFILFHPFIFLLLISNVYIHFYKPGKSHISQVLTEIVQSMKPVHTQNKFPI